MSVETRRASETDLSGVAEVLDLPRAAAKRLLQTRSVEVAIEDGDVTGCLSFAVRDGVIEVTRIAGSPSTIRHLLATPRRIARDEKYPIVALLPDGTDDTGAVLSAEGFENVGRGPRFRGRETTRYRWDPSER